MDVHRRYRWQMDVRDHSYVEPPRCTPMARTQHTPTNRKAWKGSRNFFFFFLNNEKCVDARSPKPVGKEEGFRQLHVVKKKMLHMKIRFMLILKSRLYSDIHKQVWYGDTERNFHMQTHLVNNILKTQKWQHTKSINEKLCVIRYCIWLCLCDEYYSGEETDRVKCELIEAPWHYYGRRRKQTPRNWHQRV